jgi:hypothetical protein
VYGWDLNRHFTAEGIGMANEHMKRWLASLVAGDIQFKATMRHHCIPTVHTRMASVTKKDNIKCW